ncbi:superoxide dismutase [Desulfobacula phenolica]|uniref:Superoxide dismutase n=1 Tax=Desulfobacula phenolica TaxID=90732 RepID=A0A1H2I9D4_9BACT|nr:superoxide dismutase [Desulfobacula phenolica]SDU40704.1 superoxide dismutase, Fe-Mn family [Desulfobacula phenolica]
MTIILPDLPYEKYALEPHISAKTLSFHYGKHHNAYVSNLNKLIEETDLKKETLADIIKKTVNNADTIGIFNNAAQVWNHTFYWKSMKPNCGGLPTGDIAAKINADFGGYENFIEQLKNAGLTQFGSGWAWLVMKDNTLEIMKTSNADTPIAHGFKPLLTVDVWEHAYYLDYQNDRGGYLDVFFNNLVNWEFVNSNLV